MRLALHINFLDTGNTAMLDQIERGSDSRLRADYSEGDAELFEVSAARRSRHVF